MHLRKILDWRKVLNYDSHDGLKPLPVLRITYADRPQTWLYLDFPFLYYKRPLWDLVVIVLSLGGIAISVTSALPAWRRLVRRSRAIGTLRVDDRPRQTAGAVASGHER
jgi:hypothetical protein